MVPAALLRHADVHQSTRIGSSSTCSPGGARPDPRRGWLDEVEAEVRRCLEHHARRLAGRGDDRVAVSRDEARSIYERSTRAAAARSFAARVDTAETSRAARELDDLVRLLG